jgi:hypothetical protein
MLWATVLCFDLQDPQSLVCYSSYFLVDLSIDSWMGIDWTVYFNFSKWNSQCQGTFPRNLSTSDYTEDDDPYYSRLEVILAYSPYFTSRTDLILNNPNTSHANLTIPIKKTFYSRLQDYVSIWTEASMLSFSEYLQKGKGNRLILHLKEWDGSVNSPTLMCWLVGQCI